MSTLSLPRLLRPRSAAAMILCGKWRTVRDSNFTECYLVVSAAGYQLVTYDSFSIYGQVLENHSDIPHQ